MMIPHFRMSCKHKLLKGRLLSLLQLYIHVKKMPRKMLFSANDQHWRHFISDLEKIITLQTFLATLLLYEATGSSVELYCRYKNLWATRPSEGYLPHYAAMHSRKWPYLRSNIFGRSWTYSFALQDRFRPGSCTDNYTVDKFSTALPQKWRKSTKACLDTTTI